MYGNGKRLLSLLVACVLMLTMLPAIALADDAYALSVTGITNDAYAFGAAEFGYGAQAAKTVGIKATGAIKDISVKIAPATAFDITQPEKTSLAADESTTFTVTPKTGLAIGTYTATVTVSGASNAEPSKSVEPVTFTVSFKVDPATYTVTFESNGGSSIDPITKVAENTTITKPTDPDKEHFTFGGWYKEASLTTLWQFASDTVTQNITLYAKWNPITYKVTFNSNGGSTITDLNVNSGEKINKPADPAKANAAFAGWFKETGLTTPWDFDTDTVTGPTTLYAKWDTIYTVTFNSMGGSGITAQKVKSGDPIIKPANDPTRANYIFKGWFKESTYKNEWNFASDTVTGPTTLYAKWDTIYTVTFNSMGGSTVAPITGVVKDATIAAPANPTKDKFIFKGWFKESTYKTEWNFTSDTVTQNTTLYAKWEAGTTYTVTFNSNGGSAVASKTGVVGDTKITAPENPLKEGSAFDGWYKDTALMDAWDFASDTVTQNTTLYAKWKNAITYTVTFNSNGGSTVPQRIGVVKDTTITKPADPTKSGYSFLGWYKEAALETAWNFATDKVTGTTTLYAKWKYVGGDWPGPSDPYVPSNAITINPNGAGATVSLMQGSTLISASQMQTLAWANRGGPVVFYGNGYTITFPRGSISTYAANRSIDLGLRVNSGAYYGAVQTAAWNNGLVLMIDFNHNGELPGQAQITFNLGAQYAKRKLDYYYYNPQTGMLEYRQTATADKNGNVTVTQSRCSTYALTLKGAGGTGIPKTGDNINAIPYLLLGMAAVCGAFTIRRKFKANNV